MSTEPYKHWLDGERPPAFEVDETIALIVSHFDRLGNVPPGYVRFLLAEVGYWHAACDVEGIPHDAAILARHHRGNAAFIAATDAATKVLIAELRVQQLETELEECALRIIEARNPGIDIEQVRIQRALDRTVSNEQPVRNIGGVVRAMSCFAGGGHVEFTGNRADLTGRLPREERMRSYENVTWAPSTRTARPLDAFPGLIPVAVELVPGAEPLPDFQHPVNAVYVFGPEDGSLPKGVRHACHRFLQIPSTHCLNLAAAVYVVLYDRAVKLAAAGIAPLPALQETRGGFHTPSIEELADTLG